MEILIIFLAGIIFYLFYTRKRVIKITSHWFLNRLKDTSSCHCLGSWDNDSGINKKEKYYATLKTHYHYKSGKKSKTRIYQTPEKLEAGVVYTIGTSLKGEHCFKYYFKKEK